MGKYEDGITFTIECTMQKKCKMLEDSWIIKETDDEVIGATIMAGCNMTDFLTTLVYLEL